MKNWRRILVTGMVAGMIAVTGCSSNVPETNQGNRNGQRVVDAVNRRTDSNGLTRARNTGERTVRGFNRGFRRATRTDGVRRYDGTARTRQNNHVAHPGLGLDGSNHYRHHGLNTGTTRNIPNRSNTFNRGHVGHTFGYDNYHQGTSYGIDGVYNDTLVGHDLGRRTDTRVSNMTTNNSATLNNRVVRSTPARTNTTTRNTAAKKNTTTNVTRSTNTVNNTTAKAVQPTRKAASTKAVAPTRSNTRNTNVSQHNTTVRPSTTLRPSTTMEPIVEIRDKVVPPMLHNSNNGTVNRSAPSRATANRQRRLTTRTERARYDNRVTRSHNAANPVAPNMDANPIANPSATRGVTRGNTTTHNQNRASRRAASRNVGTNGTTRRLHGTSRHIGNTATDLGHTVPANAIDNNDYAFFKRNKTEETPATPAPVSSPETPAPNRLNRTSPANTVPAPAPAVSPIPTTMGNDYYNNFYDDMHDLNDTNNYDDGNYNIDFATPDTNTDDVKYTPVRNAATPRAMK